MIRRSSQWQVAFVLCVFSVLVLALVPAPPRLFTTGWDKSNHFLAFSVMAWLGGKAFPQRLVFVLLGLLAYGALIEILQSLSPTRSAEWFDLVADALGIALGWAIVKGQAWVADKG